MTVKMPSCLKSLDWDTIVITKGGNRVLFLSFCLFHLRYKLDLHGLYGPDDDKERKSLLVG